MLTADEARKLAFEAKGEVVKEAIIVLQDKVRVNAKKGITYADIDIYNKIPFANSITDEIVQRFENLGYAVSVTELDTAIKITVSWLEE